MSIRIGRTVTAAGVAVGLAAGVASADLTPVGPGAPGNSWSQGFNYNTAGNLDFFALRLTSSTFGSPAVTGIGSANWSQVYQSGDDTQAALSGPANVPVFGFTLHFTTNIGSPLVLDVANFSGNTLVSSQRFSWDGSQWNGASSTWNPDRGDFAVPLPSAGAASLAGMLAIGLRRRRTA